MPGWVKNDDEYVELADDGFYVKRDGSYTVASVNDVTGGFVKRQGALIGYTNSEPPTPIYDSTYTQFYVGSDPRTYTFIADNSRSFRRGTWVPGDAYSQFNHSITRDDLDFPIASVADYKYALGSKPLRQGTNPMVSLDTAEYYPGFGQSDTYFHYTGLVTIGDDISGNRTSLAQRLATRPVVKSAVLSLKRYSPDTHGTATGAEGLCVVGAYSGSLTSTYPSPTSIVYPDNSRVVLTSGGAGVVEGDRLEVTFGDDAQFLVEHAAVLSPFAVSNTDQIYFTGDYTGRQYMDDDFIVFYGAPSGKTASPLEVANAPILTVTLDYI